MELPDTRHFSTRFRTLKLLTLPFAEECAHHRQAHDVETAQRLVDSRQGAQDRWHVGQHPVPPFLDRHGHCVVTVCRMEQGVDDEHLVLHPNGAEFRAGSFSLQKGDAIGSRHEDECCRPGIAQRAHGFLITGLLRLQTRQRSQHDTAVLLVSR